MTDLGHKQRASVKSIGRNRNRMKGGGGMLRHTPDALCSERQQASPLRPHTCVLDSDTPWGSDCQAQEWMASQLDIQDHSPAAGLHIWEPLAAARDHPTVLSFPGELTSTACWAGLGWAVAKGLAMADSGTLAKHGSSPSGIVIVHFQEVIHLGLACVGRVRFLRECRTSSCRP